MKRRVKAKAWISEIEVYDRLDGHTLAMECQTVDLKPFELTLAFHPRAPLQSTRGNNWCHSAAPAGGGGDFFNGRALGFAQ